MALTPVEIKHMTPGRGLFGYKAGATDRLLAEIAASFEDVWRERADLADRVEQLEADLVRFRELEALLRTTLVSAERASADMKEQARREGDLIVGEARAEARALQREALRENERLVIETRRLRAQLTAALASVAEEPEASAAPEREAEAEPEPEAEPQARRGEEPERWTDTWHDLGGETPRAADAA